MCVIPRLHIQLCMCVRMYIFATTCVFTHMYCMFFHVDIIEDANVTLTINDCNFISNIENRRSRNHPRTIIIIASTTSVIVLLAVVASIAGCHFWKKRKLTSMLSHACPFAICDHVYIYGITLILLN